MITPLLDSKAALSLIPPGSGGVSAGKPKVGREVETNMGKPLALCPRQLQARSRWGPGPAPVRTQLPGEGTVGGDGVGKAYMCQICEKMLGTERRKQQVPLTTTAK